MTITAAADGSALGNPGPNGWAWYIDDDHWAAGGSPHGTNNQGELQAVLELLRATAGEPDDLVIQCDSKYVIDSVTKWMPGWKRRGWRKADGGAVMNRDLLEALDEAMQGRTVRFEWVRGHNGHPLNEAADQRANAAAKAYQQKKEPQRGPGFRGASVAAIASDSQRGATSPDSAPRWSAPTDLLAGLEDTPAPDPVVVTLTLTPAEHARLRARAEAAGVSVEDALRQLI